VRLSETGPTATAFWRGALALPFLVAWALIETRATRRKLQWDRSFAWAGFFFAGDLALWHASLMLTSVAASTLEANLAPVVVTVLAWILYRERPKPLFVAALGLAMLGILGIVAPKLAQGGTALAGDALGIATAFFYAAYLISVTRLRTRFTTGILMLQTTLVFTALLLPLALALDEKLLPDTPYGWAVLFGLAFIAQFVGQGLIAYALAHLPTTLGAAGLYLQPVAAAGYAWWLLGEQLEPVQIAGGALALIAIALARRSRL
jgi:drug/metabolite transporter (DMT)-like permease